MKLKDVTEKKLDKLSFFLSYIDISKTRVLQLLRQETNKLDNIQNLKESNLNLLNAMEERWFVKRGISFFDRTQNIEKDKRNKIDSTIYFLVDPKKIDVYSLNMLKKMEETLSDLVTANDYVVTFGSNVNVICQKLELNVIEHFDYSFFENLEEFSQKVSALIEVGLKNNLFSKAKMMMAQVSNSHSDPVFTKQILPFESIVVKADGNLNRFEKNGEIGESSQISNGVSEYLLNHKKVVSNINIGKAEWNPDIYVLHEQLTKTIIKQSIYESKILSNIEQFTLELQMLEEKKNKLVEQRDELIIIYNKARKEEYTMQSLLLYAAFKIRNEEEEEFPLVKTKRLVK